jgi:ATP-dependent Clp endopeptidase proteolytic subunit ClpP
LELQAKAKKSDSWYNINNSADDTAEVWIYGAIGDPYGDGSGVSASVFAQELAQVKASNIKVRLNTEGGSVFEGVAIYNAIKDHSAHVDVVVDSLAASAGSFIAMAGDTITMTRNARMMIHDAHGFTMGPAADMREMADLLDDLSNNIADIYVQKAGGTVAEWRELMSKDTWFTAEQAVDAGLADKISGKEYKKRTASNKLDNGQPGRVVDIDPPPSYDFEGLRNALRGVLA